MSYLDYFLAERVKDMCTSEPNSPSSDFDVAAVRREEISFR